MHFEPKRLNHRRPFCVAPLCMISGSLLAYAMAGNGRLLSCKCPPNRSDGRVDQLPLPQDGITLHEGSAWSRCARCPERSGHAGSGNMRGPCLVEINRKDARHTTTGFHLVTHWRPPSSMLRRRANAWKVKAWTRIAFRNILTSRPASASSTNTSWRRTWCQRRTQH